MARMKPTLINDVCGTRLVYGLRGLTHAIDAAIGLGVAVAVIAAGTMPAPARGYYGEAIKSRDGRQSTGTIHLFGSDGREVGYYSSIVNCLVILPKPRQWCPKMRATCWEYPAETDRVESSRKGMVFDPVDMSLRFA